MAFRFPFSTLHELNLDWILEKVKEFAELIPPMQEAADDVQQAIDTSDQAVQIANDAKAIAEQAAQAVVPDGSITTPKLADGAVNSIKIGDDAVTTAKIQDNAITNDKMANNSVGLNELQAGSVGTNKLMDSAVTAIKLDVNAVTTSRIADGAVTENKIADDAVTYNKLDSTLESDITGALSDISTLQTALTVSDEEYTLNDVDNIINTAWRRKVFKCGGFKVLTGSFTISIPQDSDFHTIGSVSSGFYPAANTFMSFSQNITGTIEIRISTAGNIAIKNSNGSSAAITGMEISFVVPYV